MVNAFLTAGGILLAGPLRAVARVGDDGSPDPDVTARRLDDGWEFYRGSLEGGEAAWSRAGAAAWEPTQLPHCFNALNECDPDTPYFRGQGWYRARIEVANPFESGRTVLNFQGAGQTSSLWVGGVFVGKHKGGYDEFSFDITEAIARLQHSERQGGIPVVVCCDNTPDADRVPSELSDFCLYGGLYRHVNLAYLPPVSLNAVHIEPVLDGNGAARITVSARLYNPAKQSARCTLTMEIVDPHGRTIHSASARL
ncbi:MAG TPA: glycoside hydrolase family 2, partial [Terracidiphilus sp.]|nr:glycoside hydrolase family 2 [Terracidiphilus sp.]